MRQHFRAHLHTQNHTQHTHTQNTQTHTPLQDHLNDVAVNTVGLAGALAGKFGVWWLDPAAAMVMSCWLVWAWGRQAYGVSQGGREGVRGGRMWVRGEVGTHPDPSVSDAFVP